ncbi:unnamed protein product [Pylaiella littoralis]
MDIRECFIDSILYDRLDIFNWICGRCDLKNTYWFNLASQFGNIVFLKVMYRLGFAWDETTTLEAAEFGHLKILIWLYENGCPIDERVILRSAVKGYEDIVTWSSEIICDARVLL